MPHSCTFFGPHCFLLLALLICPAWALTINIQATQIVGSVDQYRIRLFPQNGSPPYSLLFSRLPENWFGGSVYLFAPRGNSSLYSQSLVSVEVEDSQYSLYKVSLVFILNKNNMFLDSTLYDYTLPIEKLSLGQFYLESRQLSLKEKTEINIQNIIDSTRKQAISVTYSKMNEIFYQIVSPSEIEKFLNNNKISAIIKVISRIASSRLNCIQQLAYLSQISALSYKAIREKKGQLARLRKQYIENQKNQIRNKQFSISKTSNNQLYVNQLTEANRKIKISFFSSLNQLKQNYTEYNVISDILTKKKKELILTNQYISQSTSKINEKYQDLTYLLENRQKIEPNSSKFQLIANLITKQIRTIEENTTKLKQAVSGKQHLIAILEKSLDERAIIIKNLQIDIQNYQYEISCNNNQLLLRSQTLPNLEDQNLNEIINIQTAAKKVAQYDRIIQSSLLLASLQNTIDYLEGITDQIYFQCYGVKNIQPIDRLGIYLYQITYQQFSKYIANFQGDDPNKLLMPLDNSSKKIYLSRFNVLSSIWTERFGDVVQTSQANIEQKNKQICKINMKIQSRRGLIMSIQKNVIRVQAFIQGFNNKTETNYIILGICTRIEAVSKLPEPNRMIFWRGVESSKRVYDGLYILVI